MHSGTLERCLESFVMGRNWEIKNTMDLGKVTLTRVADTCFEHFGHDTEFCSVPESDKGGCSSDKVVIWGKVGTGTGRVRGT